MPVPLILKGLGVGFGEGVRALAFSPLHKVNFDRLYRAGFACRIGAAKGLHKN